MSLYDSIASTKEGALALSDARLRYAVKGLLHETLKASKLTTGEIADFLKIKHSKFRNDLLDGNVTISELASYLHAMGWEADITVLPLGTKRKEFETVTYTNESITEPITEPITFVGTKAAAERIDKLKAKLCESEFGGHDWPIRDIVCSPDFTTIGNIVDIDWKCRRCGAEPPTTTTTIIINE